MSEKTIEIKLTIVVAGDELTCEVMTDFDEQECNDIKTKLLIHYLRQKLIEQIKPLMRTANSLATLHEHLFKYQLAYDKPTAHSTQH